MGQATREWAEGRAHGALSRPFPQQSLLPCECRDLCPNRQQLRRLFAYEVLGARDGLYRELSALLSRQHRGMMFWQLTFSCDSCPWYGRPNCTRSQTISNTRHSSVSLARGGPHYPWWPCTGRDAWATQDRRGLGRSPCQCQFMSRPRPKSADWRTSSCAWS